VRNLARLASAHGRMQGFLVFNYHARYDEARTWLAARRRDGSRRDPEVPRAPGDGPLRAEPRPTRARRRALIANSGRGGGRRVGAARRHSC